MDGCQAVLDALQEALTAEGVGHMRIDGRTNSEDHTAQPLHESINQ